MYLLADTFWGTYHLLLLASPLVLLIYLFIWCGRPDRCERIFRIDKSFTVTLPDKPVVTREMTRGWPTSKSSSDAWILLEWLAVPEWQFIRRSTDSIPGMTWDEAQVAARVLNRIGTGHTSRRGRNLHISIPNRYLENRFSYTHSKRHVSAAARDSLLDWLYQQPDHEGTWAGLLNSTHARFFNYRLQPRNYQPAARYLAARGLISIRQERGGDQTLRLTAHGDDCARDDIGTEKWLDKKGFTPMSNGDNITTHIGMAIQSPIAVKSTGVTQSSGALTTESRSQIVETLDAIRGLLEHPDLSANRTELESLLEEVAREANADEPQIGRVRAAWDRLMPKLVDGAPSIAKVLAHLAMPDVFTD